MTGRFETLIYTDCRRGQGLRGDPGLQFQAKSPAIGATVMDLVQRTLLYEAPDDWASRRRPENCPPSLAHVWDPTDRVLATAQGAYLGKEVSGMRQGNQLTHIIVTTDPGSYGFVRPAQLLHAPFWTAKPAATTDCPPLDPGWQPGPYEPEAIQDFVAAQEDGRELLVTLVTALYQIGRPGADRVMFVADSPGQVIQWIAAATLLLPQRLALAIGFKVFTTSPAYCSLPVLAVHPDWAGPYRSVDNSAGFVVLDLLTRRHTAVTPDAEAQQWVGLFLDSDVYDVMDAVELADIVAAARTKASHARVVAVAAVLGTRPRPADIPAVAEWIAAGPADLVGQHGEAVVSTLLADADTEGLRILDGAAARGRIVGSARAIRAELLRSEIECATRTGAARDDSLTALPRHLAPESERRADTALIVAAIEAAPDESVDALLRVGRRHRLPLPISAFTGRAARFAAWWADRPGLPYDPARWQCGAELLDLVRDELIGRLMGPEPLAGLTAASVHEHWWRLLLETAADPYYALDAAVMAGAINAADSAVRLGLIRRVLANAAGSPPAEARVAHASAMLWQLRNPDHREALTALTVIPPQVPVDVQLIQAVTARLDAGWPDGDLAEALDAMSALATRRAPIPEPWRDLHRDDQRLSSLCEALGTATGQGREPLKKLGAIDREVVAARAGRIAGALASNQDPDFVGRILGELPRQVGTHLLAELGRAFAREPDLTAVREFTLLRNKHLPDRLYRKLEEELRRQVRRDDGRLVEAVRVLLDRTRSPLRSEWDSWAADQLGSDSGGGPHRPARPKG
jgi:hypothetical protein